MRGKDRVFKISDVYFFVVLLFTILWTIKARLGIIDLHASTNIEFIIATIGILFVLYFIAIRYIDWKKFSIRNLIFVVIAINIIFLFCNFLTSDDLFSYIFSSRVFTRWGENPYLVAYSNFPKDELFGKINTIWISKTSIYGPLFLLLSSFLGFMGGNSFWITLLSFKMFFAIVNIANIFLIYKITDNSKATFLYAVNPLVIFELYGNSHNEAILILFLLVSVYYAKINKIVFSFLGLMASVLVKYSTAILFPFFIYYFLKTTNTKKVAKASIISGLLLVVTYLPFWNGTKIFTYLTQRYQSRYLSPSLGIFFLNKIVNYGLAFQINTLIFIIIYLILLLKVIRSKGRLVDLLEAMFVCYALYILTKLSLVLVWYLIPVVCLVALVSKNKYYQYSVLSGIAVYSLLLYWFVR